MRALLQRWQQRLPGRLLLWGGLSVVLAAGVLHTLADLGAVGMQETMRANSKQQRIIIDPISGVISGLSDSAAPAAPFEVAEPATPETPAPPPAAPDEAEPSAPAPDAEPAPEPVAEGMEPLRREANTPSLPLIRRSRESLVPAPAPEITERKNNVAIPMRSKEDATRPSALYARSFAFTTTPRLAIVLTDVGFTTETLLQILALPPEITVGFSPYADQPTKQIEALRNSGHEVWAMLPAMGARYPQDDPGPLGLIATLTDGSARERLHQVLATTIGSVGVILPPDETLSGQAKLWPLIHNDIDARGLFILSTNPTRDITALTDDEAQIDNFRRADILLDSTPGPAFIRSKLAGLREIALRKKRLVVMMSARPQSLKILTEWLKEKPLGEGVVLTPLSAIYGPEEAPPEPEAPKEEGGHGGGGEAKKEEAGGHGGGH